MRAPPQCAQPRATVKGLSNQWTSDKSGQFVTVIDLYRPEWGQEVVSTLQIKLNGTPIRGKDRVIKSAGQFLMRGSAFAFIARDGDRISFGFLREGPASVDLFATVFYVPDGCEWDTTT